MSYFHTFTRESGEQVTVRYKFRNGSPDTYSPMYGADGGDPAECEIEKAWLVVPNGEDLPIELSDDESEKFELWIIENLEHDDDYFDDDFL